GQQIAFGRISGCCAAAVVVINADGSGERVLADNGFPGAWSPDGGQIAFNRNGDVYVMNVDGSGVTQLTHDGTASPTAWSPNGQQIAFISTRDGDEETYVMNAEGSRVTRPTPNTAPDPARRPGWATDATRCASSS